MHPNEVDFTKCVVGTTITNYVFVYSRIAAFLGPKHQQALTEQLIRQGISPTLLVK